MLSTKTLYEFMVAPKVLVDHGQVPTGYKQSNNIPERENIKDKIKVIP